MNAAQAHAKRTAAPDWHPHLWRILAVTALALAGYSNSFQAGMVSDDIPAIQGDARLRSVTAENVKLAFTEEYWFQSKTTGLYRPLTTLSYLFNYSVLGNRDRPVGYHVVNFGIHAANIALVYLLGLELFGDWMAAIALAALWGVHPVLTEAVTNLAGRADLLAGFGVLAGLLCHIRAASSAGRRKLAWLAALAASAGVGIFSKESGVVLPGAMLLYDLAFGGNWRLRWPAYAMVAAPFALFFGLRADMLARHATGVVPFVDNPLVGADFLTARLTALKLIASDLLLLFWPAHLSADYSFNQVPFAKLGDWKMLASAGLCVLAAGIAAIGYRRNRRVFFLMAFFFVALAPVSNLVILIGATMAERFLYLPAVGMIGCVVAALEQMKRPRVLIAVAAVLCLVGDARVFARNLDWRNSLTLWGSAEDTTPKAFRPHYSLIPALMDHGDVDAAVRESEQLLRILGPLPDERNSMRAYEAAGECFRRKGDRAGGQSALWYGRALKTLQRAEKIGVSEREQVRAANLAQGKDVAVARFPSLDVELGRTYLRMHQVELAEAALLADAGFAKELSDAYQLMGDNSRAAVALIEGLLIDPQAAGLAEKLAGLYRITAPQSCALKGGTIDMDCLMVHDQVCAASWNVAAVYTKSGQQDRSQAMEASAVNQMHCAPQAH